MSPIPGSADWLVKKEIEFGGLVTNVPRRRVSPLDPRSPEQLAVGGMIGGDRMLDHGYAPLYADHLRNFPDSPDLVVAEFGILNGTGLALWCELFPSARIIGYDIDPEHFRSNVIALKARGAFARNEPEVHVYDQLTDGTSVLRETLKGRTLDIVIDDGLHSAGSIRQTFESVTPFLSRRFVYFIEDYAGLDKELGHIFAEFQVTTSGEMTVIRSKG